MALPPRPVLALDIGGTKLAVGVVAADGTVSGFAVQATRREDGYESILRRLFDMGQVAIASSGLGPIAATV